jgi:hypothetical protein
MSEQLDLRQEVDLEDLSFKRSNPDSCVTRYRAKSYMKNQLFETVLRLESNGDVHRCVTVFKQGTIMSRDCDTLDLDLDELSRRSVRALVSKYMVDYI